MATGRVLKRIILGRAISSDKLHETLLPKRIALPIFASDALSSVAYAPDEIFLTLGLAGGSLALTHSWMIALGVVAVMLVVVASYRQNVHAYPSGGGDYEVATTNLGPRAGLMVASALLVDYVLTVAVSISSGIQNAATAMPFIRGHEATYAVILVALLTAMNLRGVRESGNAFALPTYAFMVGVLGMGVVGIIRHLTGTLPMAPSASFELVPEEGYEAIGGLALAFLLLRAFSSGCAALTGVEAISNGVPAFRKPKSRNAATTLLMMGLVAITMLMSMIMLARWTGVKYADRPGEQLLANGQPVGDSYAQDPIMGQVSKAVFSEFHPGVVFISIVTGIILILAANTAFNGFPVLGSILARDGYLPRQLHARGDRLAFSNGIIILAAVAAILIAAFNADVTRLIQLYIVGVFVSFTVSQIGMVRHWNRHLLRERDAAARSTMRRSRIINAIGAAMSGTVLIVVLATKFIHGAGYAIAAMAVLFAIMTAIHKHYTMVARELEVTDAAAQMLPARVHALVLVSKLHKPTLRALAYARATRPNTLEAITVDADPEATHALQEEWERRGIPVTLKALESPYREVTSPIVKYVKSIRRASPRELVVVYVPEYVVGHWYEQILHNQTALRLRTRLHFTPGVMVASVPWQLRSSEGQEERLASDGSSAPGSVRMGR
ncbi:MAG: APC family permease [Tetrasphaera jenkinsii]|uniref:Putative membrane protein n=1 Tax=Nostocoides jenkinsii Ben 74 TaxID=1193518 RepID=A0A077MAW6_9MICO|nr:APC family permease [Tetrasphaera jenkinsii]MCI1261395.1 APC family permease [Tetrasphaera jenkinsii]CCI51912.1 putative membrane protein [Tetrasphaera jenkinsii Ben 74]